MEESKEQKTLARSYLHDISLDHILGKNDHPRKTKIICTLGYFQSPLIHQFLT